jgi:hypothetical protein
MRRHENFDVLHIVLAFVLGLFCMFGLTFLLVLITNFSLDFHPIYPVAVVGVIAIAVLLLSKSRPTKIEAACFLAGLVLSYILLWWLFTGPLANSPWRA